VRCKKQLFTLDLSEPRKELGRAWFVEMCLCLGLPSSGKEGESIVHKHATADHAERAPLKEAIDPIELLILWWRVESCWTPVEGYPKECPSTQGYRASRQHDGDNGAAETDARGKLASHIGAVIARIEEPHRTALAFLARNRSSGASVWVSPRLPADEDARAELVADALAMFVDRL
jgi:hypothetical protein